MAERILTCPSCGSQYDASAAPAGAKFVCAQCGAAIPNAPDVHNLAGRTIAGYRILRRIAEGGMGIVYLAEQVSLKRNVAFKVVKPRTVAADFQREAMAAARISHPNIVNVFDVAESEGVSFIVMEYVEGVSLRRLMRRPEPMPIRQALAITRQILSGLSRAHRHGLIHRDIKPENVLVDADGLAKVADFGLAEIVRPDEVVRVEERRGTPFYVSPEQARGEECDERTDIYSAGAVVFEMLAGRPPFRGESAREILSKAASDPVPDLIGLNPEVPLHLNDLVARMMSKSPEVRPAGADDVIRELDAIEREMALSESQAFTSPEWQRTYNEAAGGRRRGTDRRTVVTIVGATVATVAAVLALVVVGLVFWHLWARRPLPPPPRPQPPVARPRAEPRPGTPEPDVPPGTPSVPDAQALVAQELFKAASEYAQQHPDEYERIIAEYRRVIEAAPKTRAAAQAARAVKRVRERWKAAAAIALKEIEKKAGLLAAEDRFHDALAVCALPEKFYPLGMQSQVETLRAGVVRKAKERLEGLASAFDSALKEDRFDEALQILKWMEALGLPAAKQRAGSLRQRVAARRRTLQEEWAYDARANLYVLLKESNQYAAQRDYDPAINFIDKQIADKRYAAIRKRLAAERAGLAAAQTAYDKTFEYLTNNPGTRLRVGDAEGRFIKALDGAIFLHTDSGVLAREAADLSYDEIARLATEALSDLPALRREAAIALFLLYDQRFAEAAERMAALESAGMRMHYYNWRLKLFSSGGVGKAERTALARRALFRLRRARAREDWAAVLDHVSELKEIRDVAWLSKHWGEIDQAARDAGSGPERPEPRSPAGR